MKNDFFINWFKKHGRDFPWRREGVTPFQLLVTEMLLRKTTAASVSKIWTKFFQTYPSAADLARASEDELLHRLGGLGFGNKKASSLKLAATRLIRNHQGEVPENLEELLELPSVGDYTARAVLSFAFNRRMEIVDNTVQRFFSRYYGLPIKSDMRRNVWVWDKARELLPRAGKTTKMHNYGLLDFVAQVCKAGRPLCETCPLNRTCAWGRQQVTARSLIKPAPKLARACTATPK